MLWVRVRGIPCLTYRCLQVRALDAAAATLENVARGSGGVAGQHEAACAAALRAVCGAEREVLRLLVSGPVYRLVRSPSAFGMAVAALFSELGVVATRSSRDDAATRPPPGAPGKVTEAPITT